MASDTLSKALVRGISTPIDTMTNSRSHGRNKLSGSFSSKGSWLIQQSKSFQKINKEWRIKHDELQYNKLLRKGRQYSIHEGQWHGDIYIYKQNLNGNQNSTTSSSSILTGMSCSSGSISVGSSTSGSPSQSGQSLSDVFSLEAGSISAPSSYDFADSLSSANLIAPEDDDDVFFMSPMMNHPTAPPSPLTINAGRRTDSAYSSLSSLCNLPCQSTTNYLESGCFNQIQATTQFTTTSQRTRTGTTTTTSVTSTPTTSQKLQETRKFWDDLAKLCSVAHENFVLFMGACLDDDNLSIVMGKCNGPTLYQCLHQINNTSEHKRYQSRYHSLDIDNRMNISHQIAMGMAYLHGKDMVHGRLSSLNIILDYRVKICLLDHGMHELEHDRSDCGCLPRGQLTYMSPEQIREIYLDGPQVLTKAPATKESDVYTFGTILYELFAEEFPYKGLNSHELIWKIGNGLQERNVENLDCSEEIKDTIRQCWSFMPQQRPSFSEIAATETTSDDEEAYNDQSIFDGSTNCSTCDSYQSIYSLSSSSSPSPASSLPSTPTRLTVKRLATNQQQQLLFSKFSNICIRKKQKDSLSKSLFSSRESNF